MNALKSVLLLVALTFSLSSCEALKPMNRYDDAITYKTTKTPTFPKPKIKTKKAPKSNNAEISQLRFDVVNLAKNYVGTRYHYASLDPSKGFDCSGLTSHVLNNFEIKMPHGSTNQAILGNGVDIKSVRPGDLLFFGNKGRISHVAMVVSNTPDEGLQIVHSTNSQGVIVENVYNSEYWTNRLLFAKDVIGR